MSTNSLANNADQINNRMTTVGELADESLS